MQRKLVRVYRNQSDPNKVVEIELYYDLGGMSYATSSVNPRGYYLSAVPRIYGDFHGTRVKMTSAFSGVHSLIKPSRRFYKNTFAQLVSASEQGMLEAPINKLLQFVFQRNNLNASAYQVSGELI